MALTATATRQLQRQVITILGMIDPIVIEICPDKPNLKFSVQLYDPIHTFGDIVLELKAKRICMEKNLDILS